MKFLVLVITLFSINAFAAVDCVDTGYGDYRVILAPVNNGTTVHVMKNDQKSYNYHNWKTIHYMNVAESQNQNGKTYASRGFTNQRNASAAITLNTYSKNGQMFADFSENSQRPMVPNMKLECSTSPRTGEANRD